MARRRLPIEDLRTAIDCLPVDTRLAMLDGVSSHRIIVGAYADRSGGVCPMLAAHRCGGRTNFLSFARAWDRFASAKRVRRATEREIAILTGHLEASLLAEERGDLSTAIADHRDLVARRTAPARSANGHDANGNGHGRERERRRPGDPDRRHELRDRPGWAWLRPFRRYDEYELALERVEAERDGLYNGAGEERRDVERV